MQKLVLFSLLLFGCTSYNPSHYNKYVEMANRSYIVKDWNEAVSNVSFLEKNVEITDDLRVLKARSMRQIGQRESAFKYLKNVFAQKPISEILLLEIAQWHVDSGEIKEAKNLLMSHYGRGNSTEGIRRLLGYVNLHLGDWSQAQFFLAPLLTTQDEEAHFWLGQTYYKMANYKAAASIFIKTFNGSLYKKRSAQYLAWIFTELQDVDNANVYIRYLAFENSQDKFVQKMNLRNMLNLSKVDKLSTLKIYNDQNTDEWTQYKYFSEMQKSGLKNESIDYLALVIKNNPSSLWANSHYADELFKQGEKSLAKGFLQKSLPYLNDSDAKLVRTQLVFLEKDTNATFRAVANTNRYRIVAGDTLSIISTKVFKTPKRWREILKLNSHLINMQETLPVGIEIQIPEGQ